jgi:hypothetical protein
MRARLLLLAVCAGLGAVAAQGFEIEDVDYEIWDLMDATVKNFGEGVTWYDLFGATPDSTGVEINKAYRKLSLQYHPDKNSAPDAEEKFRTLASINCILRAEDKRRRYALWLERGIPFWRGRRYYFRKSENLTILESFLVMLLGFSCMQCVLVYFDVLLI